MGEAGYTPLNLAPDVPDHVLGPSCYHDKCVARTRVMRIQVYAAYLAYKMYFNIDAVRRVTDVPVGAGREVVSWLREASRRYVYYRLAGLEHSEAFETVVASRPQHVPDALIEHVEYILRRAHDTPERIILEAVKAGVTPPVGWEFLRDETETLEPLFFPPRHILRLVDWAKSLPRIFTSLIFCGWKTCYPVPEGLWPDKTWVSLAVQALRKDVISEVQAMYGALSAIEYIMGIDVEEVALTVRPGRKLARVNLFFLVDAPEHHVVQLARLQSTVRRVLEQLHALAVSNLETLDVDLSLWDEEDIEKAVRRVFFSR